MEPENSYCRLCAQLKHSTDMLNLQLEENKRKEISKKLDLVNANTNLHEDCLPKTVCFECVNCLDRAFDFVTSINHAQDVLNEIFVKNKKKESVEGTDDVEYIDLYIIPEDQKDSLSTMQVDNLDDDVKLNEKEEFVEELEDQKDSFNTIMQVDNLGDNIKLNKNGKRKYFNPRKKKELVEELEDQKDSFSAMQVDNLDDDVELHKKEESVEELDDPEPEIKSSKDIQSSSLIKCKDLSIDALPLSEQNLTWKDYSWKCSFCETQFPTIEELKIHSMQYHNSCCPYRCADCNFRRINLARFVVHVKKHRKYLNLTCHICHMKFSTKHQLNIHFSEHKVGHFCKGCLTTFSSDEELSNHMEKYYKFKQSSQINDFAQPTIAEDLTCVLCNKTLSNPSKLKAHLLIHTERKPDHICDKCGKSFLCKESLISHMLAHDNVKPHQCEICKATFVRRNQLKYHVGVHDNKKPFACEQCGRCFRLKRQLTNHKIIHTDALPYVCSFCDKRFRFKGILIQHIRQHTGIRPYSCQICQRDFTNWPNYNKHMKRRHSMNMAKKKHTPFGDYPIDQNTDKVIITAETEKIKEWKKEIMRNRKPGRSKLTEDSRINEKSH